MINPLNRVHGHKRTLSSLQSALYSGRLHHAYLFHGPDGIGKQLTALCFAQVLLCQHVTKTAQGEVHACGQCKTCQRLERRVEGETESYHPDLHWIQRERSPSTGKLGKEIKIQPIRELQKSLSFTAFEGGRRVVVIDEVERLGLSAANALLKTLEEPLPDVHFLLLTVNLNAVLPTIRSRAQGLRFAPLSPPVLIPILKREASQSHTDEEPLPPLDEHQLASLAQLSGGSAGHALALWRQGGLSKAEALIRSSDHQGGPQDILNALQTAQSLERASEDELQLWLHLLRCWYRDALVSLYATSGLALFFPAQQSLTIQRGRQLGPQRLQWRLSAINHAEYHLLKRVGSNRKLIIESLLLYLAGFDRLLNTPLNLSKATH